MFPCATGCVCVCVCVCVIVVSATMLKIKRRRGRRWWWKDGRCGTLLQIACSVKQNLMAGGGGRRGRGEGGGNCCLFPPTDFCPFVSVCVCFMQQAPSVPPRTALSVCARAQCLTETARTSSSSSSPSFALPQVCNFATVSVGIDHSQPWDS